MKKIIPLVISMAIIFTLAACKATSANSRITDGISYSQSEKAFLEEMKNKGYENIKIYDESELSDDILINRTNGEEIIVERTFGVVTNQTEPGDGMIINPDKRCVNDGQTYISYKNIGFETDYGMIIATYSLYNPETVWTDDILERYDYPIVGAAYSFATNEKSIRPKGTTGTALVSTPVQPTENLTKPTEKAVKTVKNSVKPTEASLKSNSLGEFRITAYCSCPICCGEYAYNRPIDENGNSIVYGASGERLVQGVSVAADTSILPFGTKIQINGHTYVVQDIGGAIQGNSIDVYFENHSDALAFGVKYADVKIV